MSDSNTASLPVQDAGVLPSRRASQSGDTAATSADDGAHSSTEAPDTTARSSAIMAAGTLVSRVLGLVRVALLATALGASGGVVDAFSIANSLPNFIYLMVAGGVFNAVLVPQIIKATQNPDRGADFISRLITLAVIVLLVLTALVTLAAPLIMTLVTDFSGERLALATIFAYWCLPQIFFYGLYAIIGQVLNANGSFGPYMWAPVANNIVSIAALVSFIVLMGSQLDSSHTPDSWTSSQTLLLAGGTTLGIIIQALVLFWPLKRLGLGLKPTFGWRGVGLGRTGKLASITIITMLVGNGLYLVNIRVASIAAEARPDYLARVPPQQIAGPFNLDIGTMVYVLPHSVIALSIATVMFNQLAAAHSRNDLALIKETLSRGLRIMGVATVFGAAVLLALAVPLGMLFSGGIRPDGALNAVLISLLAIGAPFLSANFFLNRVFYAAEDAVTPLRIQLILSVIGVALALISGTFAPEYIVPLLAVSYSLGNIIAVVVSHTFLVRKIGSYGAGRVYDVHVRLVLAGMASAAVGTGALWLFGGYSIEGFVWQSVLAAFSVLAVCGTLMALVYLLMLKVLRIRELDDFLAPLLSRFTRTK
ncbi:lipid II flippase MurJ [Arthrobacter sp. Bz4]|uniref:murein biosynthesis integral membrane protein MurJ n=1 Tax=Arthrobacter sp. Bz4 TaxID=2171979 RepID=UPI000D5174EB|nr:lipid II flippase MurJ [Arthrobacter sp. Bz4]PVE19730.1 virulence factor MviN [Arthrobacter sp. Bz4]